MATNKQRRDAERLRLQRQLEERRQREIARKRFTLIASIVGTLVVIAAVVLGVIAFTGDDDDDKQTGSEPAATRCDDLAKEKGAVTFRGVTVGNAAILTKEPKVCSAGTTDPTAVQVKDLVVGKGAAPALTSSVSVQYTGVLYKKGTQFDSSWSRGQAADFSLQGVVGGFTQGIGGNPQTKIPAMKPGGRRIVIVPAALGYGAQGSPPSIPANTSLVFVIDLLKVTT